jgi:hypothetical protein
LPLLVIGSQPKESIGCCLKLHGDEIIFIVSWYGWPLNVYTDTGEFAATFMVGVAILLGVLCIVSFFSGEK